MKEFNILQHSQSNFEGLKNNIINVRNNNRDFKRDRMQDKALTSFQNAGGSIHNTDHMYGDDYDKGNFGLDQDSPRDTTEENKIKKDPNWETNEKFNRWIIVEAGAKKHLP